MGNKAHVNFAHDTLSQHLYTMFYRGELASRKQSRTECYTNVDFDSVRSVGEVLRHVFGVRRIIIILWMETYGCQLWKELEIIASLTLSQHIQTLSFLSTYGPLKQTAKDLHASDG